MKHEIFEFARYGMDAFVDHSQKREHLFLTKLQGWGFLYHCRPFVSANRRQADIVPTTIRMSKPRSSNPLLY